MEKHHPRVFLTRKDVQRARRNIEGYQWAREFAEERIRATRAALDRSPEWIREHCPGKGVSFANGITGCPVCGGGWGSRSGADCDFARPGTVRCQNGHILPNADYPDPGPGYIGGDGRVHYFVGSYNAWVVDTYGKWCRDLAFAYAVTGAERYAEHCAHILDVIAEIFPSCDKGAWDYPADPPTGRLCYQQYHVSRELVALVDCYDKIGGSPALDRPSCAGSMSRRENVEQNLLRNGADYCYRESLDGALHNGIADYVLGTLAVGCLLDIKEYIDWALSGPFGIRAMLANNVDRDGHYIETALLYALHTGNLYLTFAELFYHYRGPGYPRGINLYDVDDFSRLFICSAGSLRCAGRRPRYGDSRPDTASEDHTQSFCDDIDIRHAERFFARVSDPRSKRIFSALLRAITDGDTKLSRAKSLDRDWLLFHAKPVSRTRRRLPAHLRSRLYESVVYGQKGIGILRTPAGPFAQACLMRYGPVQNHGHFDDLNINYVALGRELTYDLGTGGDGSTHLQQGWAKQSASHQLVLVDELRQQPNTDQDGTGGSLIAFAAMPGLQMIEADAAAVYRSRGVTDYRRLLALVGYGPDSYLLDIFLVRGGRQHDYLAHGPSDEMSLEGVALGEPEPGSLAGPRCNWGERLQNDGFLSGIPRKLYWSPPPENGLGFLMHPRRGVAGETFSATWHLPAEASGLRLTMLAQKGIEIISAWSPGAYTRSPKSAHIVARRRATRDEDSLSSVFVTTREPFADPSSDGGSRNHRPCIQRIERLEMPPPTIGLAVYLVDGGCDRFIRREAPGRVVTGQYTLDGRFGRIRERDGHVIEAQLVGRLLSGPGFSIKLDRPGFTGRIVRLDLDRNLVYVDVDLPDDGRLTGLVVRFDNPAYSRNSAYTIQGVRREDGLSVIDMGTQKIVLGQGVLDRDPECPTLLTSLTPHDYARGLTRCGTDFFRGKALVSVDGKNMTRVISTRYARPFELRVESSTGFKAGDGFLYLDLQAGDVFSIDNVAAVRLCKKRKCQVSASDDAILRMHGSTEKIVAARGADLMI